MEPLHKKFNQLHVSFLRDEKNAIQFDKNGVPKYDEKKILKTVNITESEAETLNAHVLQTKLFYELIPVKEEKRAK